MTWTRTGCITDSISGVLPFGKRSGSQRSDTQLRDASTTRDATTTRPSAPLEHGAAEDDDGCVRVVLADILEQLGAGHVGQVEVGDDQGRPRPAEHLSGLAAIARKQASVVRGEEHVVEELADQGSSRDEEDVAMQRVVHASNSWPR
jgi:hypothetical protein